MSCTAAAALRCSNAIIRGTVLLPQLRALRARDCPNAAPLLPLLHLTQLCLLGATAPAAELTQLASLTSLRSVAVCYDWNRVMVASGAFWQLLALPSLSIDGGCREAGLPAQQVLQQLSQAAQLTRLVISHPKFEAITPEQLLL